MALSWAGCFGLMGFWWVFLQIGRPPDGMLERDLLRFFIALKLAGAMLHINVISAAYLQRRRVYWFTISAIGIISVSLTILV